MGCSNSRIHVDGDHPLSIQTHGVEHPIFRSGFFGSDVEYINNGLNSSVAGSASEQRMSGSLFGHFTPPSRSRSKTRSKSEKQKEEDLVVTSLE